MLTFKQFIALMEGLNPIQKQVVSKWIPAEDKVHAPEGFASRKAVELSSNIIPEGQHHIIIPAVSGVMGAVHEHLAANGFRIKDYAAGLAEKLPSQQQIDKAREFGREVRPQEISIGKALGQTKANDDLITGYESDNRQRAVEFNNDHHILISREANAVAGCSTDKPWKSCGTMGPKGSIEDHAAQYLPAEIKHGTLVAYQIPKEFAHLSHDEQIDHAISRVLLKPFTSAEGHTILRPEDKSYSKWDIPADLANDVQSLREKNVSLISALENFTSKHYPLRDLEYRKNPNVYNDDKKSVRINFDIHPYGEHRKQLIKKLKKGEFNLDDIEHAEKNGYCDDGVIDASVTGFFRKLNRGVLDKGQAFYHRSTNTFNDLIHTDNNKNLLNKVLTKKIDDDDIDRDWYDFFHYKELINPDTREHLREKILSETRAGRYKDDFIRIFPGMKELHPHARNDLLNKTRAGIFDTREVDNAVIGGYFDGEVKKAFSKDLVDNLRTGKYDYIRLRHAIDRGYFDNEARGVVKKGIIDKFNNGNFDTREVDNAVIGGYFDGDVKEAARKLLIDNLRKGKMVYDHIIHAENNGYYDNEVQEASKKGLIDNLRRGEYNYSHMRHAEKNGYYDNEVQEASKKGLIVKLENGRFDKQFMSHAEENGYLDDEVKEASKKLLIDKLKGGYFDIDHMSHASKFKYLDKEVKKASRQTLIDSLRNGTGTYRHLAHASSHKYLNKEVKEAARQALLVDISNNNIDQYFKHLLNHAFVNGYLDDEVNDALLKRGFKYSPEKKDIYAV